MTTYGPLTRQCLIFIVFGATMVLGGCISCPPYCAPPTNNIVEGVPRYHSWDLLLRDGAEKKDQAMYTYVLFGRRVDKLDNETRKRYQDLLDAIVAITPSAAEAVKFDPEKMNVFYIPYNNVKDRVHLDIKHYNAGLSMAYLGRMRNGIQGNPGAVDRLGSRPGPFLVSVTEPLGTNEKIVSLLYADLSDANAAAMTEIVAAYKSHIEKNSVEDIERFTSLRLKLLSWILDADSNLQIIQSAFAGSSPANP